MTSGYCLPVEREAGAPRHKSSNTQKKHTVGTGLRLEGSGAGHVTNPGNYDFPDQHQVQI